MAEPAAPGGFDIRRILLLGGVAAVLIITIFIFLVRGCSSAARSSSGFTLIYSNMELKDAANAIARLKELSIPYEIREEGRSIAVPKAKADEARLGLAEKSLPAGGVVGWEIFDQSKLGATDFDRRIQLIRAISGELSRTIRRIQGVEDARVQIVIPETKLFAENVAPVTAAVMLRLHLGAELAAEKITGIIHLVASSVENLQPENVTIIDNTGRILTAKSARTVSLMPMPEMEISQEVSAAPPSSLTTTTLPMISTTTSVPSTTLMSKAVLPAIITTPEAAGKVLLVRQAKKELEHDLAGKAQEILNRFYPLNSVIVKTNIELNKTKVELLKKEELKIKRVITVVLIDNRLDLSKQLKQTTFKAVAAAVAYNKRRGDKIVLQLVPFHLASSPPEIVRGETEKPLPSGKSQTKLIIHVGWLWNLAWLLLVVLGGFVVVLVWRALRQPKPAVRPALEPSLPPSRPLPSVAPLNQEKVTALENIKAAVERNPERIAELLRDWLSE
ncbi:flagellar M-ring protein FliF [Candidatus Saganbacteria bacterium]|nr:flagellar M-ring protein FliF [Candidatus Saganbacteria bacterium]